MQPQGIVAFAAVFALTAAACSCGGNTVDPTAQPAESPAATAATPQSDNDPSLPACAPGPGELLSTIIAALEARNTATVFNCLSSGTRVSLGPLPRFDPFLEFDPVGWSLLGFPSDAEVFLSELVAPDTAVVAIQADRLVQFSNPETGEPVRYIEEDAVYAGVAVREQSSWRLDVVNHFVIQHQRPAYSFIPAGEVEIFFEAVGAHRPGDPDEVLIWADEQLFLRCARAAIEDCVTVKRMGGGGVFQFSLPTNLDAGFHEVVIFFEQGGAYGVGAWSFAVESAADDPLEALRNFVEGSGERFAGPCSDILDPDGLCAAESGGGMFYTIYSLFPTQPEEGIDVYFVRLRDGRFVVDRVVRDPCPDVGGVACVPPLGAIVEMLVDTCVNLRVGPNDEQIVRCVPGGSRAVMTGGPVDAGGRLWMQIEPARTEESGWVDVGLTLCVEACDALD